MKQTKILPVLAVVLCLPGVVVRALHMLNGFDIGTGLPAAGDAWVWYFTALLVLAAVIYAALSVPLRAANSMPFEQLLGTQNAGFRMAAVISGLLLAVGGVGYLYLTMTTGEEDAAGWAKALEIVYAAVTILCGLCAIGLAKAQGSEMTEQSAKLTLVPLLWSCLHLLVNYRMTCIDPNLASFAFGLVADVMLVLALYHLARLLYGKPHPAAAGLFRRGDNHDGSVRPGRLRPVSLDGRDNAGVVRKNGAARLRCRWRPAFCCWRNCLCCAAIIARRIYRNK